MPVVISPSLVLGADGVQPLTHARIGIHTFATAANLVDADSDDGDPGFPALAVTNPLTYESWRSSVNPPTASSLVFDRGLSPDTLDWDYCGIAAHNLGSTHCVVKVYSAPTLGSPTLEAEFIPDGDAPIMALFGATQHRYGYITLEPQAGAAKPQIAVIYMGKALAMQRPIYGGHQPITLSRVTSVRPQVSETGHFLGRSIIRRGFRTEFSWRHLTPEWYRAEFDPFVLDARKRPWFIAWRPETYPDEIAYCWTPSDIRPTNMGLSNLMEVSVPVEALDVAAA